MTERAARLLLARGAVRPRSWRRRRVRSDDDADAASLALDAVRPRRRSRSPRRPDGVRGRAGARPRRRTGSNRDRVRLDSHSAPDYRGRYHGHDPRVSTPERPAGSEDHARISDLVTLIQELTSRGIAQRVDVPTSSPARSRRFSQRSLRCGRRRDDRTEPRPLHLTRGGAESLVDDALIERIRQRSIAYPDLVPKTDVVVKPESHALPPQRRGARARSSHGRACHLK